MTKIIDNMNVGPNDLPVADTLDLAPIKERHRRRVTEFVRWKSDIWPEEYEDIVALIREVENLRERERNRAHEDRAMTEVVLTTHGTAAALFEENRRLSARVAELQQEIWWFGPLTSRKGGGDSGGPA